MVWCPLGAAGARPELRAWMHRTDNGIEESRLSRVWDVGPAQAAMRSAKPTAWLLDRDTEAQHRAEAPRQVCSTGRGALGPVCDSAWRPLPARAPWFAISAGVLLAPPTSYQPLCNDHSSPTESSEPSLICRPIPS